MQARDGESTTIIYCLHGFLYFWLGLFCRQGIQHLE